MMSMIRIILNQPRHWDIPDEFFAYWALMILSFIFLGILFFICFVLYFFKYKDAKHNSDNDYGKNIRILIPWRRLRGLGNFGGMG
jgi:heme/copper-type cytochrome/quinol oxidase subunit 2